MCAGKNPSYRAPRPSGVNVPDWAGGVGSDRPRVQGPRGSPQRWVRCVQLLKSPSLRPKGIRGKERAEELGLDIRLLPGTCVGRVSRETVTGSLGAAATAGFMAPMNRQSPARLHLAPNHRAMEAAGMGKVRGRVRARSQTGPRGVPFGACGARFNCTSDIQCVAGFPFLSPPPRWGGFDLNTFN